MMFSLRFKLVKKRGEGTFDVEMMVFSENERSMIEGTRK